MVTKNNQPDPKIFLKEIENDLKIISQEKSRELRDLIGSTKKEFELTYDTNLLDTTKQKQFYNIVLQRILNLVIDDYRSHFFEEDILEDEMLVLEEEILRKIHNEYDLNYTLLIEQIEEQEEREHLAFPKVEQELSDLFDFYHLLESEQDALLDHATNIVKDSMFNNQETSRKEIMAGLKNYNIDDSNIDTHINKMLRMTMPKLIEHQNNPKPVPKSLDSSKKERIQFAKSHEAHIHAPRRQITNASVSDYLKQQHSSHNHDVDPKILRVFTQAMNNHFQDKHISQFGTLNKAKTDTSDRLDRAKTNVRDRANSSHPPTFSPKTISILMHKANVAKRRTARD